MMLQSQKLPIRLHHQLYRVWRENVTWSSLAERSVERSCFSLKKKQVDFTGSQVFYDVQEGKSQLAWIKLDVFHLFVAQKKSPIFRSWNPISSVKLCGNNLKMGCFQWPSILASQRELTSSHHPYSSIKINSFSHGFFPTRTGSPNG